mmetsp:Transcript_17791/g.30921  ORF Transcript_17791/g.30921 Transcript_17791/m.30921 type:complete len:95 (+) Transcript_17791:394-678(+)
MQQGHTSPDGSWVVWDAGTKCKIDRFPAYPLIALIEAPLCGLCSRQQMAWSIRTLCRAPATLLRGIFFSTAPREHSVRWPRAVPSDLFPLVACC